MNVMQIVVFLFWFVVAKTAIVLPLITFHLTKKKSPTSHRNNVVTIYHI